MKRYYRQPWIKFLLITFFSLALLLFFSLPVTAAAKLIIGFATHNARIALSGWLKSSASSPNMGSTPSRFICAPLLSWWLVWRLERSKSAGPGGAQLLSVVAAVSVPRWYAQYPTLD